MGKANFTEDFKRDAVAQVTERGYPVAEVAARLGISKYSLYEWRKRYGKPAAVARDDDQAIWQVSDTVILPRFTYGFTWAGGMSRTSCPSAISSRPHDEPTRTFHADQAGW